MILYLQQSTYTNHSSYSLCGASCVVRVHDEYIMFIIIARYPQMLVDCCVGYSIHHLVSMHNFLRPITHIIHDDMTVYTLLFATALPYYAVDCLSVGSVASFHLMTSCRLIVASIIIVSIRTHHSWCRSAIYCSAALIDFLGEGQFMPIRSDPIGYF